MNITHDSDSDPFKYLTNGWIDELIEIAYQEAQKNGGQSIFKNKFKKEFREKLLSHINKLK